MPVLSSRRDLVRVLEETRTIAVLGASSVPHRAGFYVPEYLQKVGYRVIPVNPQRVGERIWGEPVVATLADVDCPIDMIDVFRRSEFIAGHTDEILALDPLPRVVWFQLMVHHPPSAERLSGAGIDVVQNRCTYADHRSFGIPSK
jgi:predicted CoA-binding protein